VCGLEKKSPRPMGIEHYIIHTLIHRFFHTLIHRLFFRGGPTRDAPTCESPVNSLTFSILYWVVNRQPCLVSSGETVNRQPLCLVSSGETVKPFPLTDVPDMLSTRRCNRFIRRCRRLVVIGFHSVNRPPSSPHRSGYQRSPVALVALSLLAFIP
jgi:hypothetical protein